MNEPEVRQLVRDAIARHRRETSGPEGPVVGDSARLHRHASHAMFVLPAGIDTDGPCLIEPAVTCNHCGYCKSYGH